MAIAMAATATRCVCTSVCRMSTFWYVSGWDPRRRHAVGAGRGRVLLYPWRRAGYGWGVVGGWWIGPTNHTAPSQLCPGQFYGKGVLRVFVFVGVSVCVYVCVPCVLCVVGCPPPVYHTGSEWALVTDCHPVWLSGAPT